MNQAHQVVGALGHLLVQAHRPGVDVIDQDAGPLHHRDGNLRAVPAIGAALMEQVKQGGDAQRLAGRLADQGPLGGDGGAVHIRLAAGLVLHKEPARIGGERQGEPRLGVNETAERLQQLAGPGGLLLLLLRLERRQRHHPLG